MYCCVFYMNMAFELRYLVRTIPKLPADPDEQWYYLLIFCCILYTLLPIPTLPILCVYYSRVIARDFLCNSTYWCGTVECVPCHICVLQFFVNLLERDF